MKLFTALSEGKELLKNAGVESPVSDACLILGHVLGCDKAYIYTHNEDTLDRDSSERFFKLIDLRCNGVPVQYITGQQEFMSLNFNAEPGVLIPRQDTEILVETVIDLCRQYKDPVRILEIGVGSGCIAVSLAHFIKNSSVVAADISDAALKTAYNNALLNGVEDRIDFIKSDIFDKLHSNGFDFIVSNPPYIRRGDIETLQREIRDFEPIEALDGGTDGLAFYREIVKEAPEFLSPGGWLVFEVGYDQACQVKILMEKDFYDIDVCKDLSGIERVVKGKLKKVNL